MELDFEIDKITESIENVETGESLDTLVLPVTEADLKSINKQNNWNFDWNSEFCNHGHQVYKLTAEKEPAVIHGLISFEKLRDHIYMHLIESAPFNIGKTKKYFGVPCNLVAYACKQSKDCGFDGVVVFESKTALIPHYEKVLGAVLIGGRRMAVLEERADFFINKYFPETED